MPPMTKYACFTSYNLDWQPKDHHQIKFAVWQFETCPTSGREHMQGYAELEEAVEWKIIKEIFENAHVEKRKGSQKAAIAYCLKAESRLRVGGTYGTKAQQGKRNDLDSLKEIINNGGTLREVAETDFTTFLKFHKGFEKYQNLLYENRNAAPFVYINWGKAGKGKTRDPIDLHGIENCYIKDASHKWWDGYTQQKVIIIDDFDDKSVLTRNFLLKLLDRYPMEVEIKGGFIKMNSKYIYFTSNYEPKTWKVWDNAFERRITSIHEM